MKLIKFNFIFLFFLTLFFLVPFSRIFSVKFVDGHDFILHFRMIYILEKYLSEGILFPRWLSEATYGYGSPVFTFMWGVPYYLGALLHKFGLSYEYIFKILLILPNLLSGIGCYLWLKSKYGKFAAFVSAVVFIWTPYRFLDTFIRNAIGELFFFAFLPFIFFFLDKAKNKFSVVFGSIFCALLIYSHQGLSLFGYPILIVYILLQYLEKKKPNIFINQIFILIGGLLLTCFYWLPVIINQHLLPIAEGKSKSIWFPPLLSLIRSKWEGWSVFNGKMIIMSFQIGLTQLSIILLSHLYTLFLFLKKKKIPVMLLFWLFLFWLSIFFLQPISKWTWINIPLIINLQFPYRLLFIHMFSSAVILGILLTSIKKKNWKYFIGILFLLAVIVANRNHLIVQNKEIVVKELDNYEGTFDVGGEKLPKYVTLSEIEKEESLASPRMEFLILSGKGEIQQEGREKFQSTAVVETKEKSILKIRRIYFPGWEIYLNSRKLKESEFQKGNGVFISLPKGKFEIKAEYKDPPLVVLANIISILSFLYLLIILSYTCVKYRNQHTV